MDFRSVDSSTRKEIRGRAIKLILSGKQKKKVAELYGVNQNTITNWVKKHKSLGVKGLVDNKRRGKVRGC